MSYLRKNYILVWLDKSLSNMHTQVGSYEELKELSRKLSLDNNIITIDLYEKTETIKNNLVDFLLEKDK